MKSRKKFVLLAVLIGLTGLSGAYGAISDTLKVTNHISVGDVNIDVSELTKKGSVETEYQAPETVVPGMKISKILRISNLALPCWVRARIVYSGENEEAKISDAEIQGITEDWVKKGEYFYYTQKLKRKTSVDFFQGVLVPARWSEKQEGKKFGMTVVAEAIQAANFTPDFSSEAPWGNQKIELCVHEQDGAMTCQKPKTSLSVELNGKVNKLLAVPDDFFTNLGYAMPGDVLENSITISNTAKETAELMFKTNTKGRNQKQMNMLKEVGLTISLEGKQLFKGNLASEELQNAHSLGSYTPGTNKKMTFRVEIPASWDNSYAAEKTDVTWIFFVKTVDKEENKETENKKTDEKESGEEKGNQETGTGSSAGERTYAGSDGGSAQAAQVKTGDSTRVELMLGLLAVSGGVFFVLRRKAGRNERGGQ